MKLGELLRGRVVDFREGAEGDARFQPRDESDGKDGESRESGHDEEIYESPLPRIPSFTKPLLVGVLERLELVDRPPKDVDDLVDFGPVDLQLRVALAE